MTEQNKVPLFGLGRWCERAPGQHDPHRLARGSATSNRGGPMKTNLDVLREATEMLMVATQTLISLGGEQATGAVLEDLAWKVRHGMFLKGKTPPPRPPAGHA